MPARAGRPGPVDDLSSPIPPAGPVSTADARQGRALRHAGRSAAGRPGPGSGRPVTHVSGPGGRDGGVRGAASSPASVRNPTGRTPVGGSRTGRKALRSRHDLLPAAQERFEAGALRRLLAKRPLVRHRANPTPGPACVLRARAGSRQDPVALRGPVRSRSRHEPCACRALAPYGPVTSPFRQAAHPSRPADRVGPPPPRGSAPGGRRGACRSRESGAERADPPGSASVV